VGLPELFVAVLLTGVSIVNASIPAAVWSRSRDGRFLLLSGANLTLGALGAAWTWGELPLNPPTWTGVELPVLLLGLLAALFLLAATLWRRHL